MTVLHAGGKFDKDSYKVSEDYGVGVSCVNALSSLMRVEVTRRQINREYSCGIPKQDVQVVAD